MDDLTKYILISFAGAIVWLGLLYLIVVSALKAQNKEIVRTLKLIAHLQAQSLNKDQRKTAAEHSESSRPAAVVLRD